MILDFTQTSLYKESMLTYKKFTDSRTVYVSKALFLK